MKKYIGKISGGFAVGFVNALLGAGGGMLAVPILTKLEKNRKKAHSSSVAVIMPLSVLSAFLYLKSGDVTFGDALPFLPFGLVGAAVGTYLLKKISNKMLCRIFALLMIWAGIRLLLK